MVKVFKSPISVVAAFVSTSAWAAEQGADEVPGWVMGVATGVAVAIGLVINQMRQGKKNASIWASIEPILQKGPATLQEIAEGANMGGFMAKGKVVLALQEMTANGRLEVIEAPSGTPQLQKVKFIKYKLKQ
jgi:hypothetical protein